MEERPAVSVIVPTFDRAWCLPRAVRSVLVQGLRDLEVLVVDDASTDGTEAVVGRIEDGRVRYHRLGERRGPATARNVGIGLARGDRVGFLDSDDELLPGHTETLAAALDSAGPEVGLAYGQVVLRTSSGTELTRPREGLQGRVFPAILEDNLAHPSSVLIRRACLEEVRFDERLGRGEDWDLFNRLATRWAFVHVPEPVSVYRVDDRPDRLGTRMDTWLADRGFMLENVREALRDHPRAEARWHYATGRIQLDGGDVGGARQSLRRALRLEPLRAKHLLAYTAVRLGAGRLLRGRG